MPDFEATPLTAAEYLQFQAIIDRLTYSDTRRQLSEALVKIRTPQGYSVAEAWQRAARRMWRTAPGAS